MCWRQGIQVVLGQISGNAGVSKTCATKRVWTFIRQWVGWTSRDGEHSSVLYSSFSQRQLRQLLAPLLLYLRLQLLERWNGGDPKTNSWHKNIRGFSEPPGRAFGNRCSTDTIWAKPTSQCIALRQYMASKYIQSERPLRALMEGLSTPSAWCHACACFSKVHAIILRKTIWVSDGTPLRVYF